MTRSEIRALPGAAWILFAGTFINRFGSFVLVFLVLYLTGRGFSAGEAGIAVASYGVGGLAASLAGGYLADRIGRRNTIVLSMFSAAGSILALGQAQAFWPIVVLAGLTGLTAEAYRPASAALLADFTPPGGRVTVFALYRLAINLGTTAGPAVGGLLAGKSFDLLFYGDALTCAAFGTTALLALPAGDGGVSVGERAGSLVRIVREDRRLAWLLLGATLVAVVFFQVIAGFPLQVEALGFSSAVYGGLLALNGLLVMLLELPLSTVTRRFAAPRVIALGYVLVGVGFGATALAPTVVLLAGTVAVWSLGEIVMAPIAQAYVADLAPPERRGRYQGAYGLTFGLGLVLGPAIGTRVFAWSPEGLWMICVVVALAAAAVVVRLPPAREAR